MKMSLKLSQIFLLIFLFAVTSSYSQNLRFKPIGADKGLKDNYVYNIQQDNNGYLWLGTGEGLCRFDGLKFETNFVGDTLNNSIIDKSYKDTQGRIWFGFRDGSIAVMQNSVITRVRPEEKYVGNIVGFTENSRGEVIVATQNKGIFFVKDGNALSYLISGLEGYNLSSVFITEEGNLLAGTFEGLFLFQFSSEYNVRLIGPIEDIPSSKILTISHRSGTTKYWVGIEDEGLFQLTIDKNSIIPGKAVKIGTEYGLTYSKVIQVFEDSERNLWVGTNGDGVFRLLPSPQENYYSGVIRYTDQNGMPSNYISEIFQDFEGNLWFGTLGQGITVLKDKAFAHYGFESPVFNDNVLSLTNDGSKYYLGGETGILVTDISHNHPDIFLNKKNGLPIDRITSLYKDDSGYLWIGTSESGIYKMKLGERYATLFSFSQNSLENNISAIVGTGNYIWVGTYGGVIRVNKKDFTKKIYTTQAITENAKVIRLPHNKIRAVFVDSKENVWVATRAKGLYNIIDGTELSIAASAELEFVAITEDKKGQLWAATDGDGVFQFSKDSLHHFSTLNGMRSNYCYSIACDEMGNIWIGHRLGMSKIDVESKKIISYSVEQGISSDCNPNAIITNSQNNLVFGTSKGLIEYDAKKDTRNISPPKLNITALKISDQDYDYTKDITLPYKVYRGRIDFIGINMKNPEGVRYQYKLEGYDDTWSEPSSVSFYNFRLEDGNYTFRLRACDELGNCAEESLLKINIRLPFWKTWWFVLLAIATVVMTVYSIIKIRERNQKLIQEYLQKSLDERTKEVVEQAEVIENKNRDITDSINYAQRIQASILPPIQRLHDALPGSFIFYQPRDIVSGDFYWYDKVWDNKFVIVCADSTGHGVPGAFMSLIGTTLIKDICSRPGVRSPSEILKTLDIEIKDALNQNIEAEQSNDGMDVIVAEFDLKTKYLRIASAMRPLILYIDGKQVYLKGNRSSVGGQYENVDEKDFLNEGFQLSSGDIVYMFSDGYPDQFGGPLGKKFKMVRLKNLIRDIHDKPMEEQFNYVRSNFNLWKEELEQVDDVLFMGIKV